MSLFLDDDDADLPTSDACRPCLHNQTQYIGSKSCQSKLIPKNTTPGNIPMNYTRLNLTFEMREENNCKNENMKILLRGIIAKKPIIQVNTCNVTWNHGENSRLICLWNAG